MVYDNDKHKLINFDFEDNKYVEHSDQYFNSKSYEFCYVCLLPVCFSHLLNVKKDTITFQSSQQYLINQTNNDFSEQCQKNINFQIIQRLIPLIFQKVPKLIVFKQFYIIDYFRFTEKFGSQTLDIQKFQDSLVQENKLKNNLYIKIMQNLQLTNYNEQQKLVILQLCCNVSIFQQKFDEKDLQFSKFINFMQNKNQKLQISLMLLYCLKFNFFSIRNFITTNNFYEKNWHKQKKIQKLDDKIFFEYQSELCSRDFFFTLIQNQNMQWKKSRMQTQSQFQKFVKQQRQGQQVLIQKAILSNEQHSQNASNQTQDAEFFLQNILWQTEQNNTFCNRFQNQENIKLITHKIYQRVNQFLQKDRQLNWDQIIIPVINLHESVNLACFIYLIISQPGNFYCCNDIVIQRQALFINWIRDKFHSLIKVNLLYNCVDDSKDTSQSVDQLQQKLKDSTNLINLFSNCCSPESTATFKELLITQAIKLYVTKQFPTLEKYFLKKVKQLKKKLASKNVSLEQFILYMEIFINAFKESQLHQSNQVFYNTLKSCFNLLQTF